MLVRSARLAFLGGVGCVLLVGCNVFDPSLIENDGTGNDGSVDMSEAPPDFGMNTGIGCTMGSRVAPARPPAEMEGDDIEELVFGLKEVLLNQGEIGWQEIGLNLDNYCSEPPVPQGECIPPNPDATLLIDGEQGIDNAFGAELYPLVELVFPELQATARMSSEAGVGVVAVRLRGYNGQDDDPRVDATLSQSVTGFAGTADQTEPPDYTIVDFEPYMPDGVTRLGVPEWEGNDWLVLRDDTFFGSDLEQPLVRDDNAYVVGRQLVMVLPDRVEIRFAGDDNGITVKLTDARAIGTLSEDFTELSDLTFAGRWSVLDLLQTTRSLGVCDGDAEFMIFRNKLQTAADVRATPGTGGDMVECDALSIGVTFQGYRSRLAGVTDGQDPPDACP
ncbi:MAG: hypothetical protein JJ863_00165 [Deltaproteobacteria bacterium]|nr:hypothetical protein [Deltaproteobacteria bacterium]